MKITPLILILIAIASPMHHCPPVRHHAESSQEVAQGDSLLIAQGPLQDSPAVQHLAAPLSSPEQELPSPVTSRTDAQVPSVPEQETNEGWPLELLSEAIRTDSIVAYTLNPEISPSGPGKSLQGFAVVEGPKTLSPAQCSQLLSILNKKSNFQSGEFVKNCTFLPDAGFRLYKKDKIAMEVLIAFYCDEIMVVNSAGKRKIRDCEKARKGLLEMVRAVFPDDTYFLKLPLEN